MLPFLDITHVRNTGIAFGIFPGRLEVVSLLTAVAVVWMLMHFARSGSRHLLFPVALGLLIGGSVSNLFDRVTQRLRHRLHPHPALADLQPGRHLHRDRRRAAAAGTGAARPRRRRPQPDPLPGEPA